MTVTLYHYFYLAPLVSKQYGQIHVDVQECITVELRRSGANYTQAIRVPMVVSSHRHTFLPISPDRPRQQKTQAQKSLGFGYLVSEAGFEPAHPVNGH